MTNKKLKPRNLQAGIIKREVVNANGRVILTGMCALHSMGIGAKSLKQKISNDELKRLAIGREAFRAVQEERKINDS